MLWPAYLPCRGLEIEPSPTAKGASVSVLMTHYQYRRLRLGAEQEVHLKAGGLRTSNGAWKLGASSSPFWLGFGCRTSIFGNAMTKLCLTFFFLSFVASVSLWANDQFYRLRRCLLHPYIQVQVLVECTPHGYSCNMSHCMLKILLLQEN